MKPTFRDDLLSGKTLIGTVVTLACPQIAEILAEVGFDWLWIDAEHSPLDMAQVQGVLQAVAGRSAGVVRVPASEEVYIKKALDIGAAGILAPHVDTVDIAERVIRFAKYPPLGERSIGVARAHGYGLAFDDYMKTANDQTAIIVQIEHIKAVGDIETILDVAGVDAVLIGPYDLSGSLGKPGKLDSPDFVDAVNRIRRACKARQKPIGIIGISVDAAQSYIEQGFSLIAVGVDTLIFGRAARDILARVKK